MEKIKIQLYTNFNHKEETEEFLAIKEDDVIKYIDLENNKMTVDIRNNIIIKENSDYHFTMDFNTNNIIIKLKKHNRVFDKPIETLFKETKKETYRVVYKLLDENIINEYHMKFL